MKALKHAKQSVHVLHVESDAVVTDEQVMFVGACVVAYSYVNDGR
jgi:hypothetical protein